MPGPRPPLVQAVQLEKRYVDGPVVVHVLAGLDLEVEAGERLAIVGESGVGKSTLLHLLGALDQPTGGRVLFDGVDVFTRSEAELALFRNREIGFVFQFHHLLGDFTALENVMLPSLIARQPRAATRARATELLERVGLRERLAALVVATHNDRLAAAMGRTLRLAGGALHELGSGPRGRAHGMTS